MKTTVRLLVCCVLSGLVFASCQKDIVKSDANEFTSEGAAVANAAADDVPETANPVHTPITTYVNGNCAGYYETLPARYSLTTKKYPLVIFIHGIGELGTGVTRLNCCGLPYWANRKLLPAEFVVNGVRFSNIYVSPQFKVRPTAADVQSVIDYAAKKYRVDPTRIYVTGLSMGGGSTYDYSVVYGQNVAAITPVCGGTRPTTAMAQSLASRNLPVWALYSEADAVVPVQWGKDWINWINTSNPGNSGNVKLTIWSGLSHNSTWGKAFNPQTVVDGYNIYEWMLRFKRTSAGGVTAPPPPTTPAPPTAPTTPPVSAVNQAPTANAGLDRTLNLSSGVKQVLLNGTLSKDSDGWLTSYVWTKVSGPATTLTAKSLGQSYASNLVAGTYVFRMTVTDNKNATAYDDITVTVTN